MYVYGKERRDEMKKLKVQICLMTAYSNIECSIKGLLCSPCINKFIRHIMHFMLSKGQKYFTKIASLFHNAKISA